jgi:hypothetical protein
MAKKPTISTISSGYASNTQLNNNFSALRTGFDNTLSLDGSTPNAMNADFDMNSNDILNAGEVDVQGLKIDGVQVYPGTTQIATTYATQNYTGNGSTVTYAMGYNPAIKSNVDVYIDGVHQNQDAFGITGTDLIFTAAPPLNSAIEIKVPVNVTSLTNTDSSQLVYTQGGTGSVSRSVENRLRDFVSVKDFGAVGDGVTDDTAAIQAAIDASQKVYLPEGVYVVNAATGILLREGSYVLGDGIEATVIYPTAAAGSIFKRVSPAVDSSYIRSVIMEKISVVMNHPATANPANYEQIAFDFRSISRGMINQCYAGNYNRGGLRATRTDPADQSDAIQGYGAIFGTSNANYCGGEVCTVENSQFYGCKKAIVVDDATLDPLSTAYATTVMNNDVQICESGIVFEQQYNAGSYIVNNVIQSVKNARGSSATTYAYRMAGRDSYIRNKYIEVTVADCDYIVRLESTAKRNDVSLGLIGNDDSFIALISDNGGWGNHNKIEYAIPSTNRYVRLDGNVDAELGRDQARVIFDGATAAIQGTDMRVSSVVRNGTGDYTITFDTNTFADANYTYSIDLQIDASGSGGSATVRTQLTGSLRIVTRNAAGAAADPLRVSVRCG